MIIDLDDGISITVVDLELPELDIMDAESPNLKQWSTFKLTLYVLSELSTRLILFTLYNGDML